MNIKKEIDYLRENPHLAMDRSFNNRILGILEALNERQQKHAALLIKREHGEPQAELKPCHLCKHEVIYHQQVDYIYIGQNVRKIICPNCSLRLEVHCDAMTKDELFKSWNR